jgi:hypothetical protein
MAWGAAHGDPAADVAGRAKEFVDGLLLAGGGASSSESCSSSSSYSSSSSSSATTTSALILPCRAVVASICRYSASVLGCRRPSALRDYVDRKSPSSSSSSPSSAAVLVVAASPSGSGTIAAGRKKGGGKDARPPAASDAGPRDDRGGGGTGRQQRHHRREQQQHRWEEERYERVVLSALLGLGRLFEIFRPSPDGDGDCGGLAPFLPELAPPIVRLLSSSRPSFRGGAYALACRACRHYRDISGSGAGAGAGAGGSPAPMLPLGRLIPELLASEKDPSNVAPLLELVLSHLAASSADDGGGGGGGPWRDATPTDDGGDAATRTTTTTAGMDPRAFAKSLRGALRRGCHGAPARDWGPAILPIVASLPTTTTTTRGAGGGEEGRRTGEGSRVVGTEKEEMPLSISVVSSLVSFFGSEYYYHPGLALVLFRRSPNRSSSFSHSICHVVSYILREKNARKKNT